MIEIALYKYIVLSLDGKISFSLGLCQLTRLNFSALAVFPGVFFNKIAKLLDMAWQSYFLPRAKAKLKMTHVSRPDFYKKRERAGGFFLSCIISYCMLSLHIITFPQGYIGALRSNINRTKHQILIKHKFV